MEELISGLVGSLGVHDLKIVAALWVVMAMIQSMPEPDPAMKAYGWYKFLYDVLHRLLPLIPKRFGGPGSGDPVEQANPRAYVRGSAGLPHIFPKD